MGKAMVNAQSTFLGAAKCYVYSMALEAAGMDVESQDAYTDLVQNMPDRISFAALSCRWFTRRSSRLPACCRYPVYRLRSRRFAPPVDHPRARIPRLVRSPHGAGRRCRKAILQAARYRVAAVMGPHASTIRTRQDGFDGPAAIPDDELRLEPDGM